jgi:hypothetical protein
MFRLRSLLCVFALGFSLAAGACGVTSPPEGPPPTGPPDLGLAGVRDATRSGTRLRLVYAQGLTAGQRDGSQLPYAFRDQELGVLCTIGTAADSKKRCLPQAATLSGYYADAGCQNPLFTAPDCIETPLYVSQPAGCGQRIYGAAPFEPGPFIYRIGGVRCDSVGVTEDLRQVRWYTRTQEIPASSLIEVAFAVGSP